MDVDDAIKLYFDRINLITGLGMESIDVTDSLGRISAEPVFAVASSPNFNASAMDGIAVSSRTTFGACESKPLRLKKHVDFIYVDTGDPITDPYDSVIMIEDVVRIDDDTVEIIKAASAWQHIRPIGEDIVAHEMIIPESHIIRPMDVAAMLAGGLLKIKVLKLPKVAIIPTGSEIIEPGEHMELGKIIESNSRMFEGMVLDYGGKPLRYKPVPDNYELLKKTLKDALQQSDAVVVNAGSSAGSEDYTAAVISELGEVLVHGIAARPGKPAILGIVDNKPVIGIPGYPVSAYFVFETFVKPLILKYGNRPEREEKYVEAVVSKRIVSSLKYKEFVRMKLGKVGENLIATPLSRGAGATMSLVRADGILTIPQNSEGIEAGEKVEIKLLKDIREIYNTLVSIGSHDLAMDIIGNHIHRRNSHFSLSSAHVGSMGGIMAIKRNEAHIAPVHLLDETTGEYNTAYIRKYLAGTDMALVKGLKRVQGMIIPKGNPKSIKSFKDLLRNDIQYVNRQRGAGTRILADYLMSKLGINPESIKGYDREMTTHMAVAAAVASGTADVGLGVYSAAKALELDFLPIGQEDYDFVIPVKYLNENMVQLFIEVLTSKELKKELDALGGYSTEGVGELIYI